MVKIEEEISLLIGKCKTSLKDLENEEPSAKRLITPEKERGLGEEEEGEIPAPLPAPTPIPEEEEATNIIKELKKVLESTHSAIERTNRNLSGISSAIEAQARYAYESKEAGLKSLNILNKIKEITEANRAERTESFEFVYPIGGKVQSIPAGITVIDIENGEVILADGSRGKLDNSLNWVGQEYARSLFIDAKKEFTVKLDDKIEHTVAADDFFFRAGTRCKTVSIEVTEQTSIKFWASTNPNTTLEEARIGPITGLDSWYFLSADTITAGMYVQISIYDVPTNKRLKIDSISINCSKSCIQLLEFCISTQDTTDFWRQHLYDMQGDLSFKNLILTAGKTLKVRFHNGAGETLYFKLELLGITETV